MPRAATLRVDLVAGLTAAAVVIPKAMAYATIAGLPVQVGLYTAIVPMVVYALLGSSRPLSVSTTTTIAILTGAELGGVAPGGGAGELIAASATLAVLTGAILLAAGALRLGFIGNFISESVLTGFKAGIGVVIVLDQLPKLLGVHLDKAGFFRDIASVVAQVPDASAITTLLALFLLTLIVVLERIAPWAPVPLIAIAVAIAASGALGLPEAGVATIGEVEAATSVSNNRGAWGSAGLIGFSFTGRPVSAGGSLMVASPRYATLTPNPVGEDPKTDANVYVSANIGGPVSVTAQHSLRQLQQGITRQRTGLLSTIHLARQVELTASVTRVRDERGHGNEAYAGITVLFGKSTASVGRIQDGRGGRVTVDAQRSLPYGEGYGYQMHAESGDNTMGYGVVRYQTKYGRYELRQEQLGGDANTTVSAAGSIVGIGGGVYASRPVQDSFALVRVPGVKDVRAFASHQEVGKTGKKGDLLVPDLHAYYGNILDVADGDIPLQYAVPDIGQTIALPYRGGAIAEFAVQKVQRVVGVITVARDGADRVPAYGDITVTTKGREFSSPIGSSGKFYFEDLAAGTHSAVVRDSAGNECSLTITVPSSDGTIVNLGALRCESRR
jgi:hypothetical protein